eukprot:1054615-Prorocentrum_lima.AAC.1
MVDTQTKNNTILQPSQDRYACEDFLVNRHADATIKRLRAGPEARRVQKFWDEGTTLAHIKKA